MCKAIERKNMLHKVYMYKIIKEITREKCDKIHKFIKRKVNTHNRKKKTLQRGSNVLEKHFTIKYGICNVRKQKELKY